MGPDVEKYGEGVQPKSPCALPVNETSVCNKWFVHSDDHSQMVYLYCEGDRPDVTLEVGGEFDNLAKKKCFAQKLAAKLNACTNQA